VQALGPNGRSGLHPVVDVPALALVVCDADEKGDSGWSRRMS
jgi:hypothetical protein